MRIDWVEDLLAIFDNKTLNKAAEQRFLTQPAFSRRIQAIEDNIGVTLLDRSRKPAVPHPTLRIHEDRVRELAGAMSALVRDLRQYERQQSSRVVIASQHAITSSFAPALIKDLLSRLRLSIRLRSANRDECMAMLITKQAEIIMTYRTYEEVRANESYMEDIVIGHDKLVPVFSSAMIGEFEAHMESGNLPIIGYPRDVFLGDLMNREISPELAKTTGSFVLVETALTLAAIELAATGVGVAWVPVSLAREDIRRGKLADLSSTLPTSSFAIVGTRLIGPKSRVESEIWDILKEKSAAASGSSETGTDEARRESGGAQPTL